MPTIMGAMQGVGVRPAPLPQPRGVMRPPTRLSNPQVRQQRPAQASPAAPGLRQSAMLAARPALVTNTNLNPNPPTPTRPAPPTNPVPVIFGDINGDGQITAKDARDLLNYLFLGGDRPAGLDNGDLNGDGKVGLADALRILQELASNGDLG